MPIDVAPSRIATEQLQQIPFGSLIGAPLNAAITAQAQAAMASKDFIQSVGLREVTKPDGRVVTEAISVSFSYQTSGGRTMNLVVPLLAIVPIPYIAIDDIGINFKANISAESSTSQTDTSSTSFGAETTVSVNYWFVKAEFKASYSSKKDSTATANSKYSVEYTMDVSVHASQSDMPAGLAAVLAIMNDAITARDPMGDLVVTMNRAPRFDGVGQELELTVIAVNGDNNGIPGVVVTVTPSDTALVSVDTVEATGPYGQTSVKLTAAAIPDEPAVVTIELSAPVGTDTLTESFEVTVG